MPWYPQSAAELNYISYPVGPGAAGLPISAGATNTKGSYVEFVASTPFTSNFIDILVLFADNLAAGRVFLIDVSVGGVGSEVVKIPDLPAEQTSTTSQGYGAGFFNNIPLQIPSGSRVALRCQCNDPGDQLLSVGIALRSAGGVQGMSSYTNYGSNPADSGMTALDPGATINTKGAWVELTASSGLLAQYIGVMGQFGHATVASCSWAVDIGIGAAGFEVPLIPDIRFSSATDGGTRPVFHPRFQPFNTYIAAGTRISARASCSINTATARLMDIGIILGTAPAESSGGGGGGSVVIG